MKIAVKWSRENILLSFILIVSAFLRFYQIGFQSFWMDELHTMNEAHPASTWADLFQSLKCCDQHPPLFFIFEKILFLLFGDSEVVARSISACAGVISIFIIYLLGKELRSSSLGLIAAAITCINTFHISYSQEARPYAFAFLFSCLSFLYLIKLFKDPSRKNNLLYALYTILMLYSHYFGMFAFISQIVLAVAVMALRKEQARVYFKHLLISGLLVGVCYLPWLSFFMAMAGIQKFWIAPIPPGFAIDFFFGFFDHSDLIRPFVILFLLVGCVSALQSEKNASKPLEDNSYGFIFLVCFIWIFFTYLIPYLRSVLVIPMLYLRYCVVLLPAFILLLSVGIESIPGRMTKGFLLFAFCLLSGIDLFLIRKNYNGVHKTQYRELAQFMSENKDQFYPALTQVTAWHQRYYLNKFGFGGGVLEGDLKSQLDSVVKKRAGSAYDLKGFWLCGTSGNQKPAAEILQQLDSSFILVKEKSFYDAWAQLYISKSAGNLNMIDYRKFSTVAPISFYGDSVVPVWSGMVASDTFQLEQAGYKVSVRLAGTPVRGIYPKVKLLLNDHNLGELELSDALKDYSFNFNADASRFVLKLKLENDTATQSANGQLNEDRNAFLRSVLFMQQK